MEFTDGQYHELTDNQITGAMLSYVDEKYHHLQILRNISDHKSYGNVISISDGFIKSINVNDVPKNTMSGWKY